VCPRGCDAYDETAVEECIVPGGGVALLCAAKVLEHLPVVGDEQIGVTVILRAAREPMRWIATNGRHEGSIVLQRTREMNEEEGFNARTGRYENLVHPGVIGSSERGVHCLAPG
jgi:chaperonin GroEL